MTAHPTVLALIPAAIDAFTAKIGAVPADRWTAATPCAEWTVRDLVNHVTSEHLWAPHLLRGETLEGVGDRYDGDVLGDDPAGSWRSAAAGSRAAWTTVRPGTTVHVSSGTTTLQEYAEQMHLDLVVHGWDLARGAGLDAAGDPESVAHALTYAEPFAGSAWPGIFEAAVPTDSTDPTDRLVALLGRDPS